MIIAVTDNPTKAVARDAAPSLALDKTQAASAVGDLSDFSADPKTVTTSIGLPAAVAKTSTPPSTRRKKVAFLPKASEASLAVRGVERGIGC